MHINNEILKQKRLFEHVYYVTVSRETSVHKLQSDIAKAVGHSLEYEDEPKRAAELRMTLAKREKSLLILDDVWEDITMEKVGVSVEGDGCKLLITTRKRDVCHKMNCFPVRMDPLLQEESWDLFKKQLRNSEALSLEVKNTAKLVAEECDGLPLGIVTMARSMRGQTCAHVWRDALKRLQNPCSGQHDMKEKVFRILRFSYEQLHDDKHRKCFLYCALYPEDYNIDRDELITEFIAAGLLDGANRQGKIDEGHALLNVLENASLLKFVTELSILNRRLVKMHDLVRDMAIEIIGSTGMVKAGKSLRVIPRREEWINRDLQWVSLMENLMERIEGVIPDCPNISVLLLQHNPLSSVSDCFFAHMIGLKFLNLSFCRPIKVLPDSVSNLCNLNTLLLCSCYDLYYIPSLAKLTKLTDLNLDSCFKMRRLPEGMQELASLEHLNIRGTEIEGTHRGLFPNLLNIKNFVGNYKIVVPGKELMSLKHLEKLTGVHVDGVSWFNQFVDFGWFDQMKPYSVTVGSVFKAYTLVDGDTDRRIVFNGCRLRTGAEMCLLVPQNVCRVEFWECSFGVKSLLDASPSLGDATELECCRLTNCKGFQYIIPVGWIKPLQGIRRLELKKVDEFCGLVGDEVRVRMHMDISFSGLRVLEIKECRKLKKLWMLNLDLPNLEEIEIVDCGQMEEIFATERGETVKLPRLCSFKLWCLPKLRSIWGNCDVCFPHLVSFEVIECPAVKKIGLRSYNLPSLETIHIGYCEQLEEIFSSDKEEPVKLPRLHSLDLYNLLELRSIWGTCDAFLPNLVSLDVSNCPMLKTIGLVCNLPSLERIHIQYCKQVEEIFAVEAEAGVDEIQLPKLKILELSEFPEMRSKKTIVCNSLQSVSIGGKKVHTLENCPISVIHNNGPLPVLTASDVSEGSGHMDDYSSSDRDDDSIFNMDI